MFSSRPLERVLTVAAREAVSRRHAYLTLEHLLFALAHDPDGEQILAACGADLRAAAARPGRVPRRVDRAAARGLAQGSRSRPWRSAACCRPRCSTCRARARTRPTSATCSPRSCSSRRSHAAQLLAAQGVTRLDILNYISHGITQGPAGRAAGDGDRRRRRDGRRRRRGRRAIPSRPTPSNLTERARAGPARPADRPHRRAAAHDRGALPPPQEQPGVRRRAGVGKTAIAEGLAQRLLGRRRARAPEGRGGLRARHRRAPRRHALPRRLRGALQGGHHRARASGPSRFSSSTRCTPRSAPARPPAARWISRP